MKTLILATVAAAAIALSAGTALAGAPTDHGQDVLLQSLGVKYAKPANQRMDAEIMQDQNVFRGFLSGENATVEPRTVPKQRR